MPKTPLLGITEGDPAGIGPEITVQAIHNMADDRSFIPIVYGDPAIISRACSVTGLSETVRRVTSEEHIEPEPNVINVVDTGTVPHADSIEWGSVQELAGRAAIASIEAATDAALSGKTDGVVTSPINKEAIWKTGSEFLGHTEMLGSLCGTPDTDTMFVVSGLKIFFATRHMSLREAVDSIRRDLIDHEIHKALRALKVFGCNSPKLAVAALNPHAGEGGHFGTEEIEVLRPAEKAPAPRVTTSSDRFLQIPSSIRASSGSTTASFPYTTTRVISPRRPLILTARSLSQQDSPSSERRSITARPSTSPVKVPPPP